MTADFLKPSSKKSLKMLLENASEYGRQNPRRMEKRNHKNAYERGFK